MHPRQLETTADKSSFVQCITSISVNNSLKKEKKKMGFKIRMGMAGIGLIMSYFFGFSGLSGIATHLDSTGNVLVDIADGIGLVSKVKRLN